MPATKWRGSCLWTLHDGEDSYPLKVKSWSIRRARGDLLNWSLSLPFRREYLAAGAIGQLLARKESFSDDRGTLQTWLTCELNRDGVPEPLPRLVLLDYSVSESVAGGEIQISGLCQADALNLEDQFMDQVRSTRTTSVGCHAVLTETCEEYHLGTPVLNFADFVVPQLMRMGTPRSWLQGDNGVLFPRQAWFWWNGTTLTFEAGGIDIDAATSAAALVEKSSVKVLRYRTNRSGAHNECTVQRTAELKNGLAEPQLGKSLGLTTINLTRPLNSATLVVTLFAPGSVSLVTWYDEDDTPLSLTGPNSTYRGETPAAKVQFSVNPPEGAGPFPEDIAWSAYIVGAEDVSDFSENVAATYIDESDQANRRRIAFDEPKIVPMAPDNAVAYDCAQRIVREDLCKYLSLSLDMTLRPQLRPGRVITFTSLRHDINALKFLIEAQEMRGDGNSYTMTLEICRGPW